MAYLYQSWEIICYSIKTKIHSSYICTNYPLWKLSIDSKYSASKGRDYLGNDNRNHHKHDITWERERERERISALHSIRVCQTELGLQRKQSYTLSREHHTAEPIHHSICTLPPSIFLFFLSRVSRSISY